MRIPRGTTVTIYGSRHVTDGFIGKDVWDVKKGETKGCVSYIYAIEQPYETTFDTTRMTLFVPADAPIAPNDHVVLDGNAYSVDGDPHSWRVLVRDRIHHLEIPLKAVP